MASLFAAVEEKAKLKFPELADRKIIDFANRNPSRLTRMAGASRSDTGKCQELVHCGVRIPLLEVRTWLDNNSPVRRKLVPVVKRALNAPTVTSNQSQRGRLSLNTKTFKKEGAPNGEWNQAMYKSARDLYQNGYDKQEAIEYLSEIGNKYDNWKGCLDRSDLNAIDSAYSKPPIHPPRTKFPKVFESGKPVKNSPENMKFMVRELMQLYVSYNELKERIYIKRWDDHGSKLRPIIDGDLSYIRNRAREFGLSVTGDYVLDALWELAESTKYHPFKDFVQSKPWDGKDYIEALFQTLTISNQKMEYIELFRKYLRRFLIGMVAKVYQPGSQNAVLILKGAQGCGKSLWLSKFDIAPEIFGEGAVDPTNKDHLLRHLSYVLWHVAEFDGVTNKREAAGLKDYFYREVISERQAYGRFDRIGRSCLSFCASVNEDNFLDDPTGNRRYLVIEIEKADHAHKINMQQVFAQALVAFKAGERQWFNAEEIKQVNDSNMAYEKEDRISSLVAQLEPGESPMSARDIFSACEMNIASKSDYGRFGTLAKNRGIRSERVKIQGVKVTRYFIKPITKPSQ